MTAAPKAAVLGFPVAHSLSPLLHGYWMKHYAIGGEYERIETTPENLEGRLISLWNEGYIGVNLTLPLKEKALSYVSSLEESAQIIGAINTLKRGPSGWVGMNTDAYGFIENIRACAPQFIRQTALVLGAGGAARAACWALVKEGFSRLILANRSTDKAHALARHLGCSVDVIPWEDRAQALVHADLVVNCTSLGMQGKDPLDMDLALLPAHAVVNDMVYRPLETPLLAKARRRGNPTVDGLGMLIYQAVPAFEAWFGLRPEVTGELRSLMEQAACK